MADKKLNSWIRKSLLYCVPWLIIAFFLSFFTFFSWSAELPDKSWFQFLLFELACIFPWIFFTPVILRLYKRFNFDKTQRLQSIFIHIAAASLCFSIHCVTQTLAIFQFFNEPFTLSYFGVDFAAFFNMRLVFYLGVIMGVNIIEFYKKERKISLNEPKLRTQLNETKFQGLKSQMQPQFLLHTLDSVAGNIETKPEAAEEIVADLSDLLRVMLDLDHPEQVSLIDDLTHLQLYLNVLNKKTPQSVGFENKVDSECYQARIPTVIYFIPIFEAVHNNKLAESSLSKKVIYEAQKVDDRLRHGIIFSGIRIYRQQLDEILNKVRFYEIENHLKRSISSTIQMNCSVTEDQLKIIFNVPFEVNSFSSKPLQRSSEYT